MARSTARSTFAGRLSSSAAAVVRSSSTCVSARARMVRRSGIAGRDSATHIGRRLVAAGTGSQLLDSAVELCLRLFHRGATGLHRS